MLALRWAGNPLWLLALALLLMRWVGGAVVVHCPVPSHVERHALLQLGGEANHEVVLLLVIGVHLVWHILCQVVEQLGVVMHGPSTLL
jgi:hypothetical protein